MPSHGSAASALACLHSSPTDQSEEPDCRPLFHTRPCRSLDGPRATAQRPSPGIQSICPGHLPTWCPGEVSPTQSATCLSGAFAPRHPRSILRHGPLPGSARLAAGPYPVVRLAPAPAPSRALVPKRAANPDGSLKTVPCRDLWNCRSQDDASVAAPA